MKKPSIEEKVEIKLHTWLEWKCEQCKEQFPVAKNGNEEWRFCCGEAMKMVMIRKFIT